MCRVFFQSKLCQTKRGNTYGACGDPEELGPFEDAPLGVVDVHGHDVPVARQEAVRATVHPRARRIGHVTCRTVFLGTAADKTRGKTVVTSLEKQQQNIGQ